MARTSPTVLLVTIDFHGYAQCYQRTLSAMGYDVRTYVGLRSYHWPTRARNMLTITVPNAVGRHRDRAEMERSRFARFLDHQSLSGQLVLFVNSQQLATDEVLQRISDRGGASVLWLLDGVDVHATTGLTWSQFDLVASFNRSDVQRIESQTGRCLYLPQGFDSLMSITPRSNERSAIMVGAPGDRRIAVVQETLRRGVEVELFGRYWPKYIDRQPGLTLVTRDIDLNDASSRYGDGRICLNAHSRPDRGLNPRCFEVPGAGGLLVTDNDENEQMFEPGSEMLLWQEPPEGAEWVDRATRDRSWAMEVARRGRRRALDQHTLVHRFRQLISEWRS